MILGRHREASFDTDNLLALVAFNVCNSVYTFSVSVQGMRRQ